MGYFDHQYEHTHHRLKVNISNRARLYFSVGLFCIFLKTFKGKCTVRCWKNFLLARYCSCA